MNQTVSTPANPTSESAVWSRYGAAAQAVEPALCCPVRYDHALLRAIPQEVLERDYGCGDPTPFLRPGDVVLDLGSGGGKVCFLAAQIVGPAGRVVGVDANPGMLDLARRNRPIVAARLGYDNVSFRCGLIQDLRLDLDRLNDELRRRPVAGWTDWIALRSTEDRLRHESPLIPDASIDCVVSNCVLNLVRRDDRTALFRELFRVLKPGGRAAVSDIVASADVPDRLQRDPELWSGCLSGAFREDLFPQAFADAGFAPVRIAGRQNEPWRIVEGIEFRSVTILAEKPNTAQPATTESANGRAAPTLGLLPVDCCEPSGKCC